MTPLLYSTVLGVEIFTRKPPSNVWTSVQFVWKCDIPLAVENGVFSFNGKAKATAFSVLPNRFDSKRVFSGLKYKQFQRFGVVRRRLASFGVSLGRSHRSVGECRRTPESRF